MVWLPKLVKIPLTLLSNQCSVTMLNALLNRITWWWKTMGRWCCISCAPHYETSNNPGSFLWKIWSLKHTPQASLTSLPLLSSWLTRVKEQLPEMTSKLLQLQPCQPKKEAPKTPKGRGEGKGSKGAPAKAPAVSARKLKILCLHGYRQSGKAAREKLGSFRKAVTRHNWRRKRKWTVNIFRLGSWQS